VPLVDEPSFSAILEVQDPDGRKSRHPFRHPRVQVGRQRESDLALADEAVSHQHCEFVSENGYFVVRDLRSHNGTFVNERKVGEARLRDGDEVRIGGTRIKVSLTGKVKRPPARLRAWRIVLPALGVAGLVAGVVLLLRHEQELRAHYLQELRRALAIDVCEAPQVPQLAAADAQMGGRSFAIGRISPADEKLDKELLDLWRNKLELQGRLLDALGRSQQEERESLERLSRLGQRFFSAKDRKLAQWLDGVLHGRETASDDLAQGVNALAQQTRELIGLVEAVVVRRETSSAPALAKFRFASDLRALVGTCRAQSESAASAAQGAITALGD
jgi:hypothetical protein